MPKLDTSVLEDARLRRGLTSAALAERAGISPSHLCNVEAGKKGLSPPALKRLARVLRVAARDLLLKDVDTEECAA